MVTSQSGNVGHSNSARCLWQCSISFWKVNNVFSSFSFITWHLNGTVTHEHSRLVWSRDCGERCKQQKENNGQNLVGLNQAKLPLPSLLFSAVAALPCARWKGDLYSAWYFCYVLIFFSSGEKFCMLPRHHFLLLFFVCLSNQDYS